VARKPLGKEKFKAPLNGTPKSTSPLSPYRFHLMIALVAVVILLGGYVFYYFQEQQMRQRIESGLSIVAQLKAEQIVEWRAERLMDADMLVESPFFTEGVERYVASPTDTEIKNKILARLAIIAKSYPYQDILLVDVNGKVLLSLNDNVHRLSDVTLSQLAVAIKEHKAVMVDFHYPPDSNSPHLDVIAPLFPWGQDSQSALGAVVFCIDPSQYLYPLIQSQPVPSETAEILLVERDGDQVLFLNDLRFQKDTALKLRIPLNQQEAPAVMAVLGKEGVVEGKDYREVEVLAALKHIPDSPWYMVAKIDTSEAFSAWRFGSSLIIAFSAGLLAAAIAVIGLIWQRRQRLVYQTLYQAEIEAQALRRHFEYLVKYANDIILLIAEDQHIVEVNDQALEAYGYTRREMLGLPLAALISPGGLPTYQAQLRKIQQKGAIIAEAIHQRKDGSTFPVEVSGRSIKIENKTYLQEIIRDITERKAREQEYQAIIRTTIDGFWLVDMQGRFLDVNEAYCHLTGYSREELLNMSIPDVEAVEKPEETAQRIRKIKEVGHDRFETRHRRKDGEIVDVEISVNYLSTDGGRMFVFVRDITERKRAEERLRESETELKKAQIVANVGNWVWHIQSNQLEWSEQMYSIFGIDKDDFIGDLADVIARAIHPDDRAAVERANLSVTQDKKPMPLEYRVIWPDGMVRVVWAEAGELILDEAGNPLVIRGIAQDITERKQAEKTLRESEERYRALFDRSPDCVYLHDFEGNFLDANDEALKLMGYDRKDIPSLNFASLLSEDQLPKALAALEEVRDTGTQRQAYEFRLRRKDGGYVDVEATASAIYREGKLYACQGIARDLTERKRAEEMLQKSEQRYRLLAENARDIIWTMDMNLQFTYMSPSVLQVRGYTAEEVMSQSVEEIFTPSSLEVVMKAFEEELAIEGTEQKDLTRSRMLELEHTCKDGSTVWVEMIVTFLRDENGRPIGLIGISRDITERKRAEEALRQSEGKYRTILKQMEDSYFEVDLAGNITFVNDATCRNLGYSMEELLGVNYRGFTAEDDVKHVYEAFNQVFRTGEPNKGFLWKVIRKDGSVGFAEASVSLLRSQVGGIIGFRGVGRDITERQQAEDDRRQLELKAQATSRLASVGEMAAGVAHEINNPLTAVTGYAQLLMDREDIPADIRSDLEAINDGARRVAGIVQRLLAFSRQTKPERKLVDINELIESTLVLRAYHLKVNNIEVVTRLAPDLLETVADPGQIQQVLLNLIVNAETEMKLAHGKGKLAITTEKKDNTIKICVQDDGPGIKPEVMDKIFDPFFTTREVGQGTGLGLSLCYGIVAEHKGKIYAESKPGNGATFVIELPVVTEAVLPKPPKPDVKKSQKAGKVRILVVDDEQVIRDVVNRVLTGEGHKVETVDNAAEALKKIESQKYNLILADIKMPGMSGVTLYKRIQKIDKSLARRVVFITGDIMGADTEKFLSETKVAHIDKPFDAEQLSTEVKRALAGGH